jgi:hypothetical protein
VVQKATLPALEQHNFDQTKFISREANHWTKNLHKKINQDTPLFYRPSESPRQNEHQKKSPDFELNKHPMKEKLVHKLPNPDSLKVNNFKTGFSDDHNSFQNVQSFGQNHLSNK